MRVVASDRSSRGGNIRASENVHENALTPSDAHAFVIRRPASPQNAHEKPRRIGRGETPRGQNWRWCGAWSSKSLHQSVVFNDVAQRKQDATPRRLDASRVPMPAVVVQSVDSLHLRGVRCSSAKTAVVTWTSSAVDPRGRRLAMEWFYQSCRMQRRPIPEFRSIRFGRLHRLHCRPSAGRMNRVTKCFPRHGRREGCVSGYGSADHRFRIAPGDSTPGRDALPLLLREQSRPHRNPDGRPERLRRVRVRVQQSSVCVLSSSLF